jgi:diguanylate cyclase (GGDEF)-like protein
VQVFPGKGGRAPRGGRAAQVWPWSWAALGVLIVGLALSAASAFAWRASEARHERQAFQLTAANVTATLDTLLRRDADFVGTFRALLSIQPHLSASGFSTYYSALAGEQRQVGAVGSAIVSLVPASDLSRFEALRDADPTFRALLGRWLTRVPRDGQARECLFSAGQELIPMNRFTSQMVQADWCRPASLIGQAQAPLLTSATDTGTSVALPVELGWLNTMFLETAFYRHGGPVDTVAARRAAVEGWVVSSFDIPAVIRTAVGNNHGLSVALYHANPGQAPQLVGQIGPTRAPGALRRATNLSIEGSWPVTVRGEPIAAGFGATEQGVLVFALGAVITLLVLLLARSRERALDLVAQRTGQLRHQALHDSLTSLPNRVLALDRAERMLARARRTESTVAALYLDLDAFKHVNDTFGHPAGDELLRVVAARLRSVVRESDTAARLAGDEFVVLLDGSELDATPDLVAERLLEVLREPYELGAGADRPVTLTASIGIAVGRDENAETLLADADVAMYVAKSAGKNRYLVFESGMQTAAQDRLTLEMDLADALGGEQLFLLYQPTFDLTTLRPTGVEALLRWEHPERGVVTPDRFIPIAEHSGLIVPIGRWVLDRACRQVARWRSENHSLGLAVNVSGRQLDTDELIDHVRDALRNSGLPPSALTLEITETTLMRDPQATAWRLEALKELGVRVAVDDFGTGYSSMAYLRQFPVDALKIDRSFVSGMSTSRHSAALVNTLVRLGQMLDLETVAEGIEDHAQLDALRLQGCTHGQGFLFARPLGASALEELLAVWDPLAARSGAAQAAAAH